MLLNFRLFRALYNFVSFAPLKIFMLNIGSLFQSFSGLLGLFLLLPLSRLAGVQFESSQIFSQWPTLNSALQTVLNFPLLKTLDGILFVFVLLSLVMGVLRYVQSTVSAQLQRQYIQHMRMSVYTALINSSWQFLSGNKSSEFLHRLSSQVQNVNATANQIISFLRRILSLILYVILMLLLDWKFTVMTIIVGIVIAVILFPVRWSVRDAGKKRLEKYRHVFRLLSEHLGSLKMIKSSGLEWQFQQSLNNASDELEAEQVRVVRAGAIVAFVNRMALAIGFAILVYFSLNVLNLPLVNLLLLFVIMSRLLPQLASLQTSAQQIAFSLPAFEDIERTLLQCRENQELLIADEKVRLPLKHSIRFDNVSFSYQNNANENAVVQDLDFEILANETIALVGNSGAGKTTVADLIIGLLQPYNGQVLIDGQPLNSGNLAKWRRSVAYVTQEIRLYHDSVRNNLTWVNADATDADIWHALEIAVLRDKVAALPQGLDTIIGDGGGRLSGGERQRLAIARALLAKPDVLVLDEATSALDAHNERLIHQALVNMHGALTVVIIAHSATTIKHADKILDLSQSPAKFIQIEDFMRQVVS